MLFGKTLQDLHITRMHSSRMSSGQMLTVIPVETPRKIGEPPQKLETPQDQTPPKNWRPPPGPDPPVDRMTHACENITLAKTSFRPVTNLVYQNIIPEFPFCVPSSFRSKLLTAQKRDWIFPKNDTRNTSHLDNLLAQFTTFSISSGKK